MISVYLLYVWLAFGVPTSSGAGFVTTINKEWPVVTQQTDTTKTAQSRSKKKVKKERVPAPAQVTRKVNVSRASFSLYPGDGQRVQVMVMTGGVQLRELDDLQLVGSSGSVTNSNSFIGFENVNMPFEGNVRFKAVNKLHTMVYDCEVNFKVNEPGRWVLRIDL